MITMGDIAAKAGVSRSTVSLVLNDRNDGIRIPPETRQRILAIASSMGYRRNELARAMVTGRNRVLGFLTETPSIDLEYKGRVLAGALEEASIQGYGIKVQYLPRSDYTALREIIARCIEWRLAGLIAINLDQDAIQGIYKEMAGYRIPIAVMGDIPPVAYGIAVSSDGCGGIRSALQHLVDLGHRRIAFLSGTPDTSTATWRVSIFQEVMNDLALELPNHYVVYGDWWQPGPNEQAARQLLGGTKETRPTAVLCAGDPIAMTALNVARALHIKVPQELSVVGYADYSLATYADPPLTTIAEPFYEMGTVSVQRLLERLAQEQDVWDDSPLNEVLPTRLVVRSSTAPPWNLA